MTAVWERVLNGAVIREKAMREVLEAGVRPEWFGDLRERQVFEFTLRHWQEFGQVPSPRKLKLSYADYLLLRVDDPMASVLQEAVTARRKSVLSSAMYEASALIDEGDLDEADRVLRAARHQLDQELSQGRDRELVADVDDRMARYRTIAESGTEIPGIPTGFPTIDLATGGLQDGKMTTLISIAKGGKSFILLKAAITAHALGFRPLVLTFEMTTAEQAERHDSMLAQISHTALTRGTMNPEQWAALDKAMSEFRDKPNEFHIPDMSDVNQRNVSGVLSKIEKYDPDVVFIDGLYFLYPELSKEPPGSPAALTEVSRELRRINMATNLPFFCTTQALIAKTGGAKGRRLSAGSIGYTSAFFQDCDVLLGIEDEDPDDDANNFRKLRVIESRNCGPISSTIECDWDHMTFTEVDRDQASNDLHQGGAADDDI